MTARRASRRPAHGLSTRRPGWHGGSWRKGRVGLVAAAASLAVVVPLVVLGTGRGATPSGTESSIQGPTSSRPAGLVQAGDSKTDCIEVGGGSVEPQLEEAEAVTGVTWNCLETFSDQDPYWSHWVDPWITHANSGIPGWIKADPRERSLIVSEDLIPQSITDDPDPLTWEVPCVQGHFDGYAKQFARALVGAGEGFAVIRLGMEMNGGWEDDYMGQTVFAQHEWARCFAREVTAMRSVRGAHFLFDWDPNTCTNDYPLADFYPGNAYVDIIGADAYDEDCAAPLPAVASTASWHQLYTEQLGLDAITRFAEAHHKAMSVPEWGLVTTSPGGGDDPYYVAGIGTYVAHHDVAFQSYFDVAGDDIVALGHAVPEALLAYQRAFGPSGTVPAAAARAAAK